MILNDNILLKISLIDLTPIFCIDAFPYRYIQVFYDTKTFRSILIDFPDLNELKLYTHTGKIKSPYGPFIPLFTYAPGSITQTSFEFLENYLKEIS